ncbi:sugar transferase [Microbacterium sp. USTB-Y]|uniref:sugar transferase n=1 Tax=Microbacterium sp. USTB-Y TaxID=2823692 RepID=UPI00203CFEC4|nr:sugar transferase [Microbacterium sp. USTB-Y]
MVDFGVRSGAEPQLGTRTRVATYIAPRRTTAEEDATFNALTDLVLPSRRTHDWRRAYAMRLRITDGLAVVIAVFAAVLLRFGDTDTALPSEFVQLGYPIIAAVIAVAWMAMLALSGTRDHKVIGNGSTEYKRIGSATFRTFGAFAIIAFAFKIPIARGYLLVALPLGLCLLLLGRWAWRSWLHRQRLQGAFVQRALLMGERTQLRHVAEQIQGVPSVGFQIVGAITESGTRNDLVPGVPVIAGFGDVVTQLDVVGADTVIFSGSDSISPQQMREIGWNLESRGIDLIVAPALTDIAGPRIHARPVAGLPLIYVDFPTFEGGRYLTKRAADIVVSALGLLLLSPLFLFIAVMVRRDGGPALFRQERVGLDGRSFAMLKFRTMVVDAEERLKGLLDRTDGNGMLFKMKTDPRVTPFGRWLRRYSIDELPQLINVLRGDMSLVGPRPPLASEVQRYDNHVRRRFLVKPGITGLWQVSGRSDLSWEDSVRLDLYYVENWSPAGDLMILWRTVRAVIAPEGAY